MDVSESLAKLREEVDSPDLTNTLYELEEYYERKLWHQLTLSLTELFENESSKRHDLRKKIYNSLISQLVQSLNPIKVVDFLLASYENNDECLNKLLELKSKFVKNLESTYTRRTDELDSMINNDEAIVYINLQISRFYLISNQLEKADDILDNLNSKFEGTVNNDYNTKINSAFYLAKCQLYKIQANYNLYYLNGLLYLSTIDHQKLSIEEQQKLCYDLCMSALLGDKIYNFGELILHDILNTIKDSSYDWLYSLIISLNSGKLQEFNRFLSVGFQKSPFLAQYELFLKQKIIIMSLLELISLKPTTNKQLTFKEISEFTDTSLNEVEHLIIKCFSLDLIQGSINQIDEILTVTWLQPRILNLDQVKTLHAHLNKWNAQVGKLSKEVFNSGHALWASS